MRILIFIMSVVMSFQTSFAGVKAVLFDCDGTLVDSEYIHYLGWKRALVQFGSDLTLDEYYPYVGKSAETNAALFAKKVGLDCQEQILSIKRESYPELCSAGVPSIEPTVTLLKQLAAKKEMISSFAPQPTVRVHQFCNELSDVIG